jgi:hypothetical protein
MHISWPLPRSTLGLVVTGFVLVTLPLVAAIVTAVLRIDRQAEAGYAAAQRATIATRLTRDRGGTLCSAYRDPGAGSAPSVRRAG